ncbi:UDP-2,3-diacetamido-2,3-dideoxy-D-glucuronate 2-epimerase [Pseudomonas reidholzensis]|uniref:UDP-2,3-diacetamido-2,3-dideoxy-D-glucuronate 2-epimerase n=1 Tax=Pseudomonas reidholzensis TaxID=1785162 RepID=A0A383RQV3_9PSED|nr:UDP-N-acetylglucosamine 2-epimerase (non-hydrolyzing) [Pseudomonas reidholzensis]SYX89447.1 UDP-2,3-diacetamido-2,3-dideoxy-D-glucuronate 2-epimerase [Pseudomonas reidholzensis]
MKIVTVIGARPQFIKASMVSKAILHHDALSEVIVHTGQHFDANMSAIFFEQLCIPRPDYQLGIHGGTHGQMTGRMLIEIETVIQQEKPDCVLVYGDTNSTLAAALAASKLNVPIAHVEAGLRSFNMCMPEEVNRILTDQVSEVLFCPTQTALSNLKNEGFERRGATMLNVGDVMQDSAMFFAQHAIAPAGLAHQKDFILATLHRAENTDDPGRLSSIIDALNEAHHDIAPVVLPLHPRTAGMIELHGLKLDMHVINPVGYLQMVWLLQRSSLVVTDSGGVQKEAFFFAKPCVTVRDQTEWEELVTCGANVLAGAERETIVRMIRANLGNVVRDDAQLYGGGQACGKIAEYLANM